MKKIISLLIVVALMAVCVTGCKKTQKEDSSEDKSLEKVLKQKQFVLGLDDSFPPYGYRDDGC